jgi:mono/diheme cytochrome c family protein
VDRRGALRREGVFSQATRSSRFRVFPFRAILADAAMTTPSNSRRRPGSSALLLLLPAALLCLLAVSGRTQSLTRSQKTGDKSAASEPVPDAEIERGRYIVQNVAMCPECHTPRDDNGELDRERPLDGAPEFFQPPHPDPNWPLRAPRIGGNPPASDQDMVRLLTTGIWTDGKPLRLPMMPFRMTEPDAKAVVAYLHSVHQPE